MSPKSSAAITNDWHPRVPLTLAEQFVDFPRLNREILEARERVEAAAAPITQRLVVALFETGIHPRALERSLIETLAGVLERTALLGYRETQKEITELRRPVQARQVIDDAGDFARASRTGLPGVLALIRRRAAVTAAAVIAAGAERFRDFTADLEADKTLATIAAVAAAARVLHNHVLELVGETLNMGRSAGALTMARPPQFSMRSEQLDRATCSECHRLHGEIVQVDSPSYYSLLPPTGCLGGGRCRGIMVYGDDREQVRAP